MWVLILILHLSGSSTSDKSRQIIDNTVIVVGPYKSKDECDAAFVKALTLRQVTDNDGMACTQINSSFPAALLPRQ